MTDPLVDMARQFSRAAAHYDKLAIVQHRIAQAGLRLLPASTGRVLDIGCGTGKNTAVLAARGGQVHGIDIAAGMVQVAARSHPALAFCQADAHHLPFASGSFDQVFSSMALQWSSDPSQVMQQICQVLKPGGVAGLTIMVEGSFSQLNQARLRAGQRVVSNPLASHKQWLNCASQAELNVRSALQQEYIDRYDDILSLLRSIKAVGAGALTQASSGRPMLRADLQRLNRCFPRCSEGRLALTYQVSHLLLER